MNQTVQDILERRSTRAFTDRPVEREILETVVRCGAYAPSAVNGQSRRFTVVTKKENIEKLCKLVGKSIGKEGYDMYRPTALIIPSDRRDNRFFKEDISCALENIFLAAHTLGVGSVWINQLGTCHDDKDVRDFLRSLSIPDSHGVLGIAALGYGKPEGVRPPTKTNEIFFAD